MVKIAIHDHSVQTFIASDDFGSFYINLRYSEFLDDWFISVGRVDAEGTAIIRSRKLLPNRFVLGPYAQQHALNWDLYCSGRYSTGPFNSRAFIDNNYNLYYATIQEKLYLEFIERMTGRITLREGA